jgi:hypothetical protein
MLFISCSGNPESSDIASRIPKVLWHSRHTNFILLEPIAPPINPIGPINIEPTAAFDILNPFVDDIRLEDPQKGHRTTILLSSILKKYLMNNIF